VPSYILYSFSSFLNIRLNILNDDAFMFVTMSKSSSLGPSTNDPIHVVTQFYLPDNAARLSEIRFALQSNVSNPEVADVTLYNERLYTDDELGVQSSKIKQNVIGRRIRFIDAFATRQEGYTVLLNADIFVDETIALVRRSDIHKRRAMYALLRYEYPSGALFGPRGDSQDTWILHSNHAIRSSELNTLAIELGRPGCDNKICYLFAVMGFDIYNDPASIKTHHCHADITRNYGETIPPPYLYVCPHNMNSILFRNPTDNFKSSIQTYDFMTCNHRLALYLKTAPRPFVIPRIAGIENNTAYLGLTERPLPEKLKAVMKNNAGIHFSNSASVDAYSKAYLNAFRLCNMYASWEPWGNYFPHISESQPFFQSMFAKTQVGAFVFDVFHYLYAPWTHSLRGMRLLIVSPFVDMIERQPLTYHTNLFPECTFVYVKPPQTHGTEPSRDWTLEFDDLCNAVDAVEFDVALCSCGGYGNLLCGYIMSKGRSAIYVGGVLQMYFGIYGTRWIKERKDMLTMHLTKDWKRPTMKPKGHDGIESSCYW
jgi:hypothetical protein